MFNELAKSSRRTEVPLTLTKLDAAQQQVEGAIYNLFLGNWACAVTLACAAEEILPPTGNVDDLISIGKSQASNHGMTEKQVVEMFNGLRNWLKHTTPDKPQTIQISQWQAVEAVVRAFSRFAAHHVPFEKDEILSENIFVFQCWFDEHFPELLPKTETAQ